MTCHCAVVSCLFLRSLYTLADLCANHLPQEQSEKSLEYFFLSIMVCSTMKSPLFYLLYVFIDSHIGTMSGLSQRGFCKAAYKRPLRLPPLTLLRYLTFPSMRFAEGIEHRTLTLILSLNATVLRSQCNKPQRAGEAAGCYSNQIRT